MKSWKRWVTWIIVAVLVMIVGAVAYIDYLAKAGVEFGATYALGVDTTLGSADVGIFGGSCELKKLRVANPEGFGSDHFLAMNRGLVEVSLGSLTKQTVVVPRLELDGLDLILEKSEGRSNYKVILDNLSRSESGEPAADAKQETKKEGKAFVIEEISITNTKVTVDLLPIGGELSRQELTIPEIKLSNVGSESGKGVALAELTGVLLKAILQSVINSGVDLPGNISKELGSGLAQLKSLSGYGVSLVGDVGSKATEAAKQISGELEEKVGDVGEEAGEAMKGIGDGLGGLLKEKPKQEEQ